MFLSFQEFYGMGAKKLAPSILADINEEHYRVDRKKIEEEESKTVAGTPGAGL